jgi:hypothetical protein
MDIPPPPPPVIQDDDPSLVDPGRRRLSPKSSFARLLSLPNLNLNRLLSTSFSSQKLNNNTPDLCDNSPINLDNSALIDHDFDKDRFEWAVLYENQRGQVLSYLCNIHVFSISYTESPSFPFLIIPASHYCLQTLLLSLSRMLLSNVRISLPSL